MAPHFTKFHGLGNDYIVIPAEELAGINQLDSFARRICDRHFGAGADGIAIFSPARSSAANFHVRIFNPDGSEANLSGNGTRCAAAYVYYRGLWTGEQLLLDTRSGVKKYFLRKKTGRGDYVFESELGRPRFESAAIPMITEDSLPQVIDYQLNVGNENFPVTALQMGNPNCCIFVENFASLDWKSIGREIERHPQFPERTNVVFVRIIDKDKIELRIWERGVGDTTASGTCSCAGAVAAMAKGLTHRLVKVKMPGGEVKIQWREDDEVVITGTATLVYTGEWLA